jgi:hypothetical protein
MAGPSKPLKRKCVIDARPSSFGGTGSSISSEIFTEEEIVSIMQGPEAFVGTIGRFVERRGKGKGKAQE